MRCWLLCAGCGSLSLAVVVDECVLFYVVCVLVTAVACCGLLVFRFVSVLLLVVLVCACVGFLVWRGLSCGVYRCRLALSVVGCLLIVACCVVIVVCCFGVCCGVLLFVVS